MAKSDQAQTREQRLAAKLRENLKRRKEQERRKNQSELRSPPGEKAPQQD